MKSTVIPIFDARRNVLPAQNLHAAMNNDDPLIDKRGRAMRDLRISVTDRCNFRCTYCMPKDVFDNSYQYLPHQEVLTFEEIARIAKVAVSLGVRKLRLTGGEPLMRKGIETLITMLAALRADAADLDITLTTNGAALAAKAVALKAAGLNRLTISLDSLDDATFRAMNDVNFPVANVLKAIETAAAAGFTDTKINMVVKRGVNDSHIIDMARYFKGTPNIVRFIEYMDVGATNGWRMDDVIASADIVQQINAVFPLVAAHASHQGEVATRWKYADGQGEIGVISSVTEAFCASCTRARLSTDGALYTCLFAQRGTDLKTLLRSGADDATLRHALATIWIPRDDNYSEIRTAETTTRAKVEMSFIGG